MKVVALAVFLLFPSLCFAADVDSSLLPAIFRKPFVIDIRVHEVRVDSFWQFTTFTGEKAYDATIFDTISIDHNDPAFAIRNDTLMYSRRIPQFGVYGDDQLTLILDTIHHSIPFIRIRSTWMNSNSTLTPQGYSILVLKNLEYDSVSIFSSTSFLDHVDSARFFEAGSDAPDSKVTQTIMTKFVELGGVFRTERLQNPNVGVRVESQSNGFVVRTECNILECSFEASSHVRTLEVHSLLGQRVVAVPVAIGEGHATIRLPNGLYFARLGQQVQKIYVPE
jgi:hypothetical protein